LIFEDLGTRKAAIPAVSNESAADRVHGQTACGQHFETDRIEDYGCPSDRKRNFEHIEVPQINASKGGHGRRAFSKD
jgi:hypothetical protein